MSRLTSWRVTAGRAMSRSVGRGCELALGLVEGLGDEVDEGEAGADRAGLVAAAAQEAGGEVAGAAAHVGEDVLGAEVEELGLAVEEGEVVLGGVEDVVADLVLGVAEQVVVPVGAAVGERALGDAAPLGVADAEELAGVGDRGLELLVEDLRPMQRTIWENRVKASKEVRGRWPMSSSMSSRGALAGTAMNSRIVAGSIQASWRPRNQVTGIGMAAISRLASPMKARPLRIRSSA
jgi:hypothetical protein